MVLETAIAGDPRVLAVVEESVAVLRAALENQVELVVGAVAPGTGVVWQILIDPSAVSSDFIAAWRINLSGGEVVGAQLYFRTVHDLTDDGRLLTSMMGHAFGLRDSNDTNDRMFFDWWRRRPSDFSPKEGLLLRLMLQRRAGNRWPDNDRSLGTAGLREISFGALKAPPT